MRIRLTPKQWKALKPLVIQGKRSEARLGLPLTIDNGDQKIVITSEKTEITLEA